MHKAKYINCREADRRDPMKEKPPTTELELHIEELEERIAPDGGETVLPLPTIGFDR